MSTNTEGIKKRRRAAARARPSGEHGAQKKADEKSDDGARR